ncbi:alpha/beta fold hydrolase [Herminiimonas sp.]|uniref:alpha/beta fold hydrolase n=1 Tax=Herminiimonas sp. TaxID=1926289 RepID=UPI00271F106A|nr:alpha/beta hydrolase [Herminiimonas sp.]MDO8306565.1 alpha/beta hydrolase [Herminiimonas sp.]
MTQAQLKTVQCLSPAGLHQMAYQEWGDPANDRTLICVHGLTRVSNDFDALAQALANDYRIICPDVVGRGRSGRLRDPQYYRVPQYVSDMVTLIARLDVTSVHWFGTSMGGVIGMALASLPDNPISKLLLNDIGPSIDAEALARIGAYVGQEVRFATFDEAWHYVRAISQSFGPHSDEQWRKLAADVMRQNAEGAWVFLYDPNLALPFKATTVQSAQLDEQMLWAAYDAIRCPTLVVRGTESDLLSPATALAMSQRGPRAQIVELAGIGHAPTFLSDAQIALAKNFFLG